MADETDRKTLEERHQISDLDRLRHSCAHVLATAVSRIWPDAQFAAGPPVEGGFYYDVDLKHRISPDDFPQIEAEMKKVVKENSSFERMVVSRDEAMSLAKAGRLAAVSEREVESVFKVDLLNDIPEDEEISIFKNGDFWDLCAGPLWLSWHHRPASNPPTLFWSSRLNRRRSGVGICRFAVAESQRGWWMRRSAAIAGL